jgi:hypothetical protein
MFLFLLACNGGKCGIDNLNATLGEIPTIIHLSWTNNQECSTYVEFGDGETTETTPMQTGVEQEALLLGMPTSTDVSFKVMDADSKEVLGEGSITTGPLDAAYTPLTVTDNGGPSYDGYLVTTSLGGVVGPIILDNRGNIVWWYEEDPTWVPSGARLSKDRQWVIYTNQPQATIVDEGELVKVSIDGATVERWTVPGCHHDFAEMPDGSIVVLSQDTRELEGTEVVGDRLLQVEADGTQTEVWNIFDDWPEAGLRANIEDDSTNWSHGNAIDYHEDTDSWFMSFRNFGAIVKVNRSTRGVEWVLGGALSDYTISDDPNGQFVKEHQFEVFEDESGIVVFDDRDAQQGWSRAVEYSLDSGSNEARQVWEYKTDPLIQSVVLGDVDRLENGNTIVMFSTAGQLDVVNDQGQVLWRLNTDLGNAMGYFERVDSLYLE